MQNIGNIAVYSGSVQRPDFRASVYSASQSILAPKAKKDDSDTVSISDRAKSLQNRGLSEEQIKEVDQLKKRDRQVRTHEEAHMRAGGNLVQGPFYEYTTGPDNQRYATGGSVSIDTSPVSDDPAATIRKMQRVRNAALAPVDPSPQDRRVASEASRNESKARAELRETESETLRSVFSTQEEEVSVDQNPLDSTTEETAQLQPSADSFISQRNLIRNYTVETATNVRQKEVLAYFGSQFNIAI